MWLPQAHPLLPEDPAQGCCHTSFCWKSHLMPTWTYCHTFGTLLDTLHHFSQQTSHGLPRFQLQKVLISSRLVTFALLNVRQAHQLFHCWVTTLTPWALELHSIWPSSAAKIQGLSLCSSLQHLYPHLLPPGFLGYFLDARGNTRNTPSQLLGKIWPHQNQMTINSNSLEPETNLSFHYRNVQKVF